MRGIKTSVISILAISLLAGSAVGVVAQDESRYFFGTSRLLGFPDFGEKTVIEDGTVIEELRGQTYESVIEVTDERVSGTSTGTLNQDSHLLPPGKVQPARTQWGTERIENDGGAWECTWSGGEMQFMLFQRLMWCVGEGGYEGHAMRMLSTTSSDGGVDLVGLAWQGDLPALPGPPGPSTE